MTGLKKESGKDVMLGRDLSFFLSEKKLFSVLVSASGSTDRKLRSFHTCSFSLLKLRKLESLFRGDLVAGRLMAEEKVLMRKLASASKFDVELDRRSFHRIVMVGRISG